jgi:hypothetical protein
MPIFTEVNLARQLFVKNSYTEFYVNPTKGLAAGTRSQTERQTERQTDDGWTCSPYKSFFFILL